MKRFIGFVKRNCFIGTNDCNQGGNTPNEMPIINGVVNNNIQIVHNGINVVHNGA